MIHFQRIHIQWIPHIRFISQEFCINFNPIYGIIIYWISFIHKLSLLNSFTHRRNSIQNNKNKIFNNFQIKDHFEIFRWSTQSVGLPIEIANEIRWNRKTNRESNYLIWQFFYSFGSIRAYTISSYSDGN